MTEPPDVAPTRRPARWRAWPASIVLIPTLLAAAALPTEAAAQSAPAGPPGVWIADGVIWRDKAPPTLHDLAAAAAPVMWFSPDEFLVARGVPVPASLEDPRARAVYYRALDLRTRQFQEWRRCTASPGCPVTADVSELTVRFMFYYPEDCCFGGHAHDLEVVDVRFGIAAEQDAVVVHLLGIAGAAHGVGWYTNELDVTKADTVLLPIRLFVEEGKHATAPDRNGDGVFDPKSDVNEFRLDAWGIRDQKAFNFRFSSGFQPYMFKPRRPDTQVWPSHRQDASPSAATYGLVHSPTSSLCEPAGDAREIADDALRGRPAPEVLKDFLGDKGFCDYARKPPWSRSLPAGLGGTIFRPFGMVMERVSLGYRYDRQRHGWALNIPYAHLPGIDGWIGVRVNLLFEDEPIRLAGYEDTALQDRLRTDGIVQFDVFYMRSAGRLFDWYVSGGLDQRPIRETVNGNVIENDTHPAFEAGGRLRFPLTDKLKRALHVPFLGARVGVRTSGSGSVRRTGLVVEFGLAAW